MNKVILIGRLTADPEVRYTQGNEAMCIAKYTLAVDRRVVRGEGQKADFLRCVAFNKAGEVAEKYLRKGMKVAVTGRIQTGSYKDKEGRTIYTTDILVEEQEFVEKKQTTTEAKPKVPMDANGFVDTSYYQEEMPFD